jgi:predicted TIM-barrel fold metal-dependent hydrolase
VIKYAGEDNITVGTDYGHNDQSTEVAALRNLKEKGGISTTQYEKIVYNNPRALFALA